jgi:Icc-related predicted phosphoesterase
MIFFFASDLHGQPGRYDALLASIEREKPQAVLLGGDLLPFGGREEFIDGMAARFVSLRSKLGDGYPAVLLIAGNDDPRIFDSMFAKFEALGLWTRLNNRSAAVGRVRIWGYPFVPPTPFLLKDWERYDVSHFVDPGCVSPEEGSRSIEVDASEPRYATIAADLERLVGADDVADSIFLFHAPPYQTKLDRAALDGKSFDHAPLDLNVGSIAIRRFIEARQPRLTLHGHVHESARLSGAWMDRLGRTVLLGAAHDGPELALIRFDPEKPGQAQRELI